ncbi:hypothetical protein WOLCODRAFT_77193 [Wolfiporia cocos MD-104 SS10]|uniref:G-patch domain-containing protein n=1 Tax=Wolfiporia cocos (strain MD-104) TaxID=742152 RepID=A0A2H3K7Z7_WOLCO|nr:hypothetical protein WOLCODRAFT_77193 [Wolfiporia cocos MD-104 SS10]
MTSRLKRKLNDLGVDPASSRANESFCLIGTPLPPLEKAKDAGEFVPLWKQEVRDEKGRRRLHGAFTGGFSAGYFNSVGSKEGWAPSTFVSSRTDRAKARAARPEDFMDDEDLAERAEGRALVDTTEEMDFDFGATAAERRRAGAAPDAEADPISAALAASLAPAPQDSVGARVLKKMGWRPGQGVGPRLTYAQRRAQDGARPGEDEEDEEARKHLYPRRDTPVVLAQRKDDSHGLGYVAGMRLEESVGAEREREGPGIAAGFGLGALNDADEDDLDVYDSGHGRHSRSRMAYDVVDDDDGRPIAMGARQAGRAQESRTTAASGLQTFSDGRVVLRGFVLSDKPVAEDRWFPLPEVPKGWTPNPRRVWEQEQNKENAGAEKGADGAPARQPPKTHEEWKNSFMSADERGSMLGETPLPSQPRSVFEFMSQKDRERLQNIKNAIPGPSTPAPSAPLPPVPPADGEATIPHVHPSVAKAALQGFQPFATDPVKHARYTAFLTFQSARESATSLGLDPLPGQRAEEFRKELEDYAKAATVFKPLSAAMADRFRSAAVVETGPTVVEGLHQPAPTDEATQEEEQQQQQQKEEEEDPRASAVRMGMFGPLTREVVPWQPARLLCKRFGVRDPEVDTSSTAAGLGDELAPTGAARDAAAEAGQAAPLAITDRSAAGAGERGREVPRDLANVGLGEDDDQGRDTLTYQRPGMDIFKAIFASDEEDSDEEDAVKAEPDEEQLPGVQVKKEPVPAHLVAAEPVAAVYVPAENGSKSPANVAEKVDLASFKPTFVPRSERESRKDKGKDKERSKKEKDKKKKGKALMSFDVEDDGFGPSLSTPVSQEKDKDKDRERRKKRRKEQKEDDLDDSMWVEAPPPEVVKSLPADPSPEGLHPSAHDGAVAEAVATPAKGRKRAIDFM